MKKITTIYLGVNNVVIDPSDCDSSDTWDEWETAEIGGSQIQYSPELIETLNSIAAREDVQFRWLSNWGADAPQLLCPTIGLNGQDWRLVSRGPASSGPRKLSKSSDAYWWKFDAFKQDIMTAPIKRLIWIDSNIDAHTDSIDNWMDPYGILEDDRLYIQPDEETALSPADIQKILNFLGE